VEDGTPVSAVPDVDSRPDAASQHALIGGGHVRWTGRGDGDLAGSGAVVERRRRQVVDLPWTVPRQVHGKAVAVVRSPGERSGVEADAAVTAIPGAAVAVLTADCAPVALASDEGVVGVAHAGWRGLAAGVVDETVQVMRSLGAIHIQAVLGPCIRTACYPFGADDLEEVVRQIGPEARGLDRYGDPALDVAAGVVAVLRRAGVDDVADVGTCTACSGRHWSWRARRDLARQATVVWRT
jgi:hypothetical protein